MVDPAERLAEHGITAKWKTSLMGIPVGGSSMRFGAELDLGKDLGVDVLIVPRLFSHRIMALFAGSVPVGDDTFDRAFYVRSSNPEAARALLRGDTMQDAVLSIMSKLRTTEPFVNRMHFSGNRLQVRLTSLHGLDEAAHQALKLATASAAIQAAA